MKKTFVTTLTAASILFGSVASGHAQYFGSVLGGGIGAAIGAAAGGRNAGAGAVVGGIIGVAMGTILQQLSQAEMQNRQVALQQAARGKSAKWSSGKKGAKARYVNKGKVASTDGRKCSKVQETITLPDGKQASSVETVCFS
jgi:membrane protease subunit (stomatin/prohibitin family)